MHEAAETRVVELDVGARPADPVQPAHEREEGLVSDGAVVLLAGRPCHGHELGAARRLDRRGEVFGALRAEVLLVQLADVVGLEDSQLAGGSIASNVEADHAPRLGDAGSLEGAAVARECGVDSSLSRALVADEDVVDVDDGDDVASVIKDDAEEVWVGGALLEPARLEDGGVLLLEDGATLLGPLEALEQTARLEFWVDEAVGLLNVHLDIELGGGGERLDDVPALELVVVGVAVGEEDEERLDPQRAAVSLEVIDARALAVPAGDPARLEAVDGTVVLVERHGRPTCP